MKSRILTIKQLKDSNVCRDTIALFLKKFGNEVLITKKWCKENAALFDWECAARNLLSDTGFVDFRSKRAPIWAEYEVKRAPIWAEYEVKRAPIWAEYYAKRAPINAEHNAKRAPIWAEYYAKRAPIWAEFQAKRAKLFAKIYIKEGNK